MGVFGMTTYIIRRGLLTLVSIWMVTVIIFLLLHVIGPFFISDRSFNPDDWTESISYFLVPEEQLADPVMVKQTLARAGLDKPILERYGFWLGQLLQGDLGSSVISERGIWDELKWRLPVSIELGVVAIIVAAFVAALCRRGVYVRAGGKAQNRRGRLREGDESFGCQRSHRGACPMDRDHRFVSLP